MRRLPALLLTLLLAACQPAPPASSFHATDVTHAPMARGFALKDSRGQVRRLEEFKGKVVLLFFGYTNCPDFCPSTLAKLKGVVQALGNDAQRVQVVFVTVDPQRDTAAVLDQYVPAFHPDFLGLRPEQGEVKALLEDFKMVVEGHAGHGATPQNYEVGHSTHIYTYDTKGRIRLLMDYAQKQTDIVADVRSLLKEAD